MTVQYDFCLFKMYPLIECQYFYLSVTSCSSEDVVFVVDSSGSILLQNWQLILDFMKNMITDFTIGPNNVQVGVVSFSDNVRPEFQLNTYRDKSAMLSHIERMRYLDQSTNTQEALRYARTTMFTQQNGDRSFAPNVVIIITDGVPQVPADLNEARRLAIQEADLLRQQGMSVFVIGIGPQITQDVINALANRPSNRYTFQVNEFRQLENILSQVASAACSPTPPPRKLFINHIIKFLIGFLIPVI